MYASHFGLASLPFGLPPDVSLRWPEPSQEAALETLRVALKHGEGFLKVVGEVGLGKSLVCRTLLSSLDERFQTAWLPDPLLTPSTLRRAVAQEFGVHFDPGANQHEIIESLRRHLVKQVVLGRRPVLLIDEAQALPDEALEAIRLLTNLETERRKLLQVVLFGQPELDRRLKNQNLRQLQQRITFSCELQPLRPAAVAAFVMHRTRAVGAQAPLFDRPALRAVARASQGVPRLINILCHKSLLAAWGRGLQRAGKPEVRRAIDDTESVQTLNDSWRGRLARWRGMFVGMVAPLAGLALSPGFQL